MEWKEVTAAWLIAAALVGLSAFLHVTDIASESAPPVADPSHRVPAGAVTAEGASADRLVEEDNLATRSGPGWPAQHYLQICRVDVPREVC